MRRLVAVAMACAALGIGISSGAYAPEFGRIYQIKKLSVL